MKTILVTGACGYIGRHVVDTITKMGGQVIALDRTIPDPALFYESIEADILSPDFDLKDYIAEKPDACLHLAWSNGFNHNALSHMEDLSGHFKFLNQVLENGIKQLAVMGSMHEVGYWEGPIDESTPCNPQSLYGIAKDALRRAVFVQTKGTEEKVQWLRGYYIYGDDSTSQSIFGKLIRAAARGNRSFPFTSGKNKYDFLSIDELAFQVAACVMQDEVTGIINCCSGKPVSLAEQVEWFIESNNLDISLEYGAFPDRVYDSPGVWGNPEKIDAILTQFGHMATP